jgi:hypothetical protein
MPCATGCGLCTFAGDCTECLGDYVKNNQIAGKCDKKYLNFIARQNFDPELNLNYQAVVEFNLTYEDFAEIELKIYEFLQTV